MMQAGFAQLPRERNTDEAVELDLLGLVVRFTQRNLFVVRAFDGSPADESSVLDLVKHSPVCGIVCEFPSIEPVVVSVTLVPHTQVIGFVVLERESDKVAHAHNLGFKVAVNVK